MLKYIAHRGACPVRDSPKGFFYEESPGEAGWVFVSYSGHERECSERFFCLLAGRYL